MEFMTIVIYKHWQSRELDGVWLSLHLICVSTKWSLFFTEWTNHFEASNAA